MKLFKKVLSVVTTMALVATLIPANASAATDVIDFEDGNIPAAIRMATMDDGSPDGDASVISVVDFEGSKRLKIEMVDATQDVKVRFDVGELFGDDFAKVRGVSYDVVLEAEEGKFPEWNGGAIGGTPTGPSNWANNDGWEINEWENQITPANTLTTKTKDGFEFTDPANSFFLHINWTKKAGITMYFDNVKFLDADGNAIALPVATEEVPADAPAATTVPKTGTTNYTVYFLGASIVLLGGAVVLRKRNSIAK